MLLRNALKPVLSCREVTGATVEECFACARNAATQLRKGWLRAIGAPDYSDPAMLQYLRSERIIPPYQTRGYKMVEMVRIYEVGKGPADAS